MKLAISPHNQATVSATAVIPKVIRSIVERSVYLAIAQSKRPKVNNLAKYENRAIAIVDIGSRFLVILETAIWMIKKIMTTNCARTAPRKPGKPLTKVEIKIANPLVKKVGMKAARSSFDSLLLTLKPFYSSWKPKVLLQPKLRQ
jgi:hypothetical protein